MSKIPYLFRRNNIFYFRSRIPFEYQKLFKTKEIVKSLKTENQAEAILKALKLTSNFKDLIQDLNSGKVSVQNYSELLTALNAESINTSQNNVVTSTPVSIVVQPEKTYIELSKAHPLSVVIDDFLARYDQIIRLCSSSFRLSCLSFWSW